MTDAVGTRTFAYNDYDELISDSLSADNVNHLITETMDSYGRSTGYTYARGGSVQQTVSYGYGTDGRLNTAGFTHGGEAKQFSYKAGDGVSPISRTAGAPGGRGRVRRDRGSYLPGTHLLHTLTMPNGMTLTQQYEQQRNLLTAMLYKRGETSVVERFYTYDTLGRPLTRTENRQGGSRSDSFTHNDRSELTNATLGTANYAYAYDNIGNRKTAQENAEDVTNYDANNLNQYTVVGSFTPEFDADGNQTKVQTSTGIWNVTYNAENRPTEFIRENADGTTTKVTCAYDYMGRRATKKVETLATDGTATLTLHQRYLYRGYLQVACCDLTRDTHPCLWLITWDPTQSTATRPLAIQKDATWYTYGWDLTKNVCEVFGTDGLIKTTYSYTPYGAVSAEGNTTQAIQWSSEFNDEELGLVYYNYRHYNPSAGRWIGRDPYKGDSERNRYAAFMNAPCIHADYVGLWIKDGEDSHIWCAERGDSLAGLVNKLGASYEDWQCLWPTENTKNHGYPNTIYPGDAYDASNLELKQGTRALYRFDREHRHYSDLYIGIEYVNAIEVPYLIRETSKFGSTPISYFVSAGHGGVSGLGPNGETRYNVNDIIQAGGGASFDKAKRKQGPARCWFSRSAVAIFSGCDTNKVAKEFADKILRVGAKAFGTNQNISVPSRAVRERKEDGTLGAFGKHREYVVNYQKCYTEMKPPFIFLSHQIYGKHIRENNDRFCFK